jgi:glycosyltransferase involved in cell wall biosynthesis
MLRTLIHLQKTLHPELTHAVTLKCAFYTGLACRAAGKGRVVHTIAGLGYLFSDGMKPKILRLAAAPFLKLALGVRDAKVIFQNGDDLRILSEGGYIRPSQCHLIPGSGVDTEKFFFSPEPDNHPPVVVMPTRLVEDKGVRIFAQAAEILKARGVQARFEIAGGIDFCNPRALSEQDMHALTAGGAVEWLGKVHDMPNLLARANLVVCPSWYREGVPKVLLEAASAGRAIVTTDHPGCREAVTDGLNGLLVPVRDASATAAAIETLLKDPERRKKMGAAGRVRAEKDFNVGRVIKETIKLY